MIYRESNVVKTILDKNKSMYKSFRKNEEKYRLWLSSSRTKTQSVEQVSLTLAKSWLCYQRP